METPKMLYLVSEYAPNGEMFGESKLFTFAQNNPYLVRIRYLFI